MRTLEVVFMVLFVCTLPLRADVVDPDADPVPILRELAEPLGAVGVDVLFSHDSEAGSRGPSFGDAPRVAPLIGFKGRSGAAAHLDRYRAWLDAFEAGARGALAAAPAGGADPAPDLEAFERIWKSADADERVVITFDEDDLATAERVAGVLRANGYAVYLAMAAPPHEPLDPHLLGRLFVEADHCLVIDTVSARLNGVIRFEADLLAQLRRQRDWVADGAEGLPPVKRESMDVIEALGVMPMQALPGGIVLGLVPELEGSLDGATFAVEGSDYGVEIDDEHLVLAPVSVQTRDAILAFVAHGESDAVVDIAGSRVLLADPLRETRLGERMVRADRAPFAHLSVAGAQKSLIVDRSVTLRREDDRVAADVELELRFYRRTGDAHAERLATVRFTVEDATGSADVTELAWSRSPRSRATFDGSGAEDVTKALEQCALDASLIALARLRPVAPPPPPADTPPAGG